MLLYLLNSSINDCSLCANFTQALYPQEEKKYSPKCLKIKTCKFGPSYNYQFHIIQYERGNMSSLLKKKSEAFISMGIPTPVNSLDIYGAQKKSNFFPEHVVLNRWFTYKILGPHSWAFGETKRVKFEKRKIAAHVLFMCPTYHWFSFRLLVCNIVYCSHDFLRFIV